MVRTVRKTHPPPPQKAARKVNHMSDIEMTMPIVVCDSAELLATVRRRKRPAGRRSGRRRPKIGLAAGTPEIGLDGRLEGIA
jgi:hypothetical protein